jgi:hypothetical protein
VVHDGYGKEKNMQEIIINERFSEINRHLSADELSRLEKSLIDEGCLDPLIVWKEKNVLLDGHNRYRICTEKKIEYRTEYVSLPNEKAAFEWIINHQLARRNLTKQEHDYLIGIKYLEKKKDKKASLKQNLPIDQNDHTVEPERTAEKIASEHGISAPTVRRAAKFAEAVNKLPPEEKAAVLAGEKKIAPPEKKEKRHKGSTTDEMRCREIFNSLRKLNTELKKLNIGNPDRANVASSLETIIAEFNKTLTFLRRMK